MDSNLLRIFFYSCAFYSTAYSRVGALELIISQLRNGA